MGACELSKKEDGKPKKLDDELREEQEKVVKNLLSEMGLTSKEVDTILSPTEEQQEEEAAAVTPEKVPKAEAKVAPIKPMKAPPERRVPPVAAPVSPEVTAKGEERKTSPGIDLLLSRFDEMTKTVASLERGIAASLSAELLHFRQELVGLRTEIATKLTDRLRLKAFAPLVENAISDVVVTEVKKLEESLLDSFSKELIGKFKTFREDLTGSKQSLIDSIKEQAEIYGAHGRSLEDELDAGEKQIRSLKEEVAKRDTIIDEQRATINDLESTMAKVEKDLAEVAGTPKGTAVQISELKGRLESQQTTIERLRGQIVETSELKASLKAFEDSDSEKRRKIEEQNVKLMELETKLAETQVRLRDVEARDATLKTEVEKLRAENIGAVQAKSKAMELESAYTRARQEVQDLRGLVDEAEEKFENKNKEVARVLKVMAKEPKYKILTILKDVGTLTLGEIARATGQPIAIAKRYSQELQQDGYVKIDGENVTGTGDWAKTTSGGTTPKSGS
jgi:DNA repair exonuclease SbcCD ATPase subunit